MRRFAATVGAVLVAGAGLMPMPAGAEPKNAEIIGVFRLADCASDPCVPGRDPTLAQRAVVRGSVQVHVRAEADLGLEWVRLEGKMPGDPRWYCLELWNAEGATSFRSQRTWITTNWTDPSDECREGMCSSCSENSPHYHGEPAKNAMHDVRVVARERGASVSRAPDDISSTFTLGIQNAPAIPRWAADPAIAGDGSVILQWAPNPEDDVVEYRFLRTGPDGARTAFAVSAENPGRHGCSRIAGLAYRCHDRPGAGAYRYSVAAVRAALRGDRCEVARGRCIVGALSESRTVTVPGSGSARGGPSEPSDEPTPGDEPTTTPTPGSRPTSGARAPVAISPEGLREAPQPIGASRAPAIGGALAALVAAAGVLVFRLRRARANPPA